MKKNLNNKILDSKTFVFFMCFIVLAFLSVWTTPSLYSEPEESNHVAQEIMGFKIKNSTSPFEYFINRLLLKMNFSHKYLPW